MKKLLSALVLFLMTALPALATTVNIDRIPTVGDDPRILSSQADREGNWVLEISESDVLKTFMLKDFERETFITLEKRAEAIRLMALDQNLPLQNVPIGEIKQLNGYYGWAILSLEMDLIAENNENRPVYRISIRSSSDGTSFVSARLDQDGLNRLFRSGEKVPEQTLRLSEIEEQ